MARTQTLVQLTDELLVRLDEEAARRGVSRSALIREAIESALADSREVEISRRIVEGYTRIPPGRPDDWGDLAAMAEQSSIESLQRLDEEDGDW